jgi:hypothetical protein
VMKGINWPTDWRLYKSVIPFHVIVSSTAMTDQKMVVRLITGKSRIVKWITDSQKEEFFDAMECDYY